MKLIVFISMFIPPLLCSCQNVEEERYVLVENVAGEMSFEDSNYIEELSKFSKNNKDVYDRFEKSVGNVFHSNNNLNYKVWHDTNYVSFGIEFINTEWSFNLRCNVHHANKIGFESVNPNYIIQDTKLRLNYCIFIQSYKFISKENLSAILKKTFSINLKIN